MTISLTSHCVVGKAMPVNYPLKSEPISEVRHYVRDNRTTFYVPGNKRQMTGEIYGSE